VSLSRALLLAAALALAAPAQAEVDPVATARHAADLLQAAAADLAEAERARDRVAALTRTVRAYEEGLVALREGLRRAAVRERALRLQFEARRSELARLLGVLQTLERAPAPLLMIHPSGPLGSARSGMILS
jgi:septal ring factor EnvC (AmiA/AmiB activator)